MDFLLPPPQDDDPADYWKKQQWNGEQPPHKDAAFGPEFPYYASAQIPGFGLPPMPFPLADALAHRFSELGFSPDMIGDKIIFAALFVSMGNCLLIQRHAHPEGGYAVTGHGFLGRKKK